MTLPQRTPSRGEPAEGSVAPTDERILDLVVAGHQHAFDVIVGRYAGRVCRYIRQVGGDGAPAEDLAQSVFIKIFSAASKFDGRHAFAPWMFRIARNVTVDWLRTEEVRRRHADIHEERTRSTGTRGASTPLQELELREFEEHLARAMEELPEVHRSAFLLREQEELSYEEIAEVLGIPPKTVSTRIHRARHHLKNKLSPFLFRGRGESGRTETSP